MAKIDKGKKYRRTRGRHTGSGMGPHEGIEVLWDNEDMVLIRMTFAGGPVYKLVRRQQFEQMYAPDESTLP